MQPTRRRRTIVIIGTALAVFLVAAACGDDDTTSTDTDDVAATGPSSTIPDRSSTTTDGSTSTSATPEACSDGALDPVATPPSEETAHLVDVDVTDGCLVSFTFREDAPVPGYAVAYDPGPFAFGESQTLDVEGSAFLLVRMTFASTTEFADDGSFTAVYEGPDVLESTTGPVTEVAFVDDFESEMRWVIGLDEELPFSVSTSDSPPTVTVAVG